MRRVPVGTILLALPLLLFLVLPLAALLARGVWPRLEGDALQAVLVSLRTTAISTGLILVLGTPVARLIGGRPWPGRGIVEGLVVFPAVLPPAAAGLALLLAFGRRGMVGATLDRIGISLAFSAGAVVLAQVYVAVPFYVRPLAAALRGVGDELREAAALDGATRGAIFRRIDLPLVRGPLLAALTLAWARALGEFGATVLFAGNRVGETQTLPLAVSLGFEADLDVAVGLATLLLAVALAVLAISALLGRAGERERGGH